MINQYTSLLKKNGQNQHSKYQKKKKNKNQLFPLPVSPKISKIKYSLPPTDYCYHTSLICSDN